MSIIFSKKVGTLSVTSAGMMASGHIANLTPSWELFSCMPKSTLFDLILFFRWPWTFFHRLQFTTTSIFRMKSIFGVLFCFGVPFFCQLSLLWFGLATWVRHRMLRFALISICLRRPSHLNLSTTRPSWLTTWRLLMDTYIQVATIGASC